MSTATSNLNNRTPSFWLVWGICFSAALFFFYEIFQLTLFNTISSYLMRIYAVAAIRLSQLSAIYLYACALSLLPAGLLLDRFSTKKLLILTCLLCTIGTASLALALPLPLLILGRILSGVGNAFAFLGCMRLAARWVPPSQVALAMGLIVTVGMLGGIFSQAPFIWLIQILAWQEAMLINTALGFIICLLMAVIIKDTPYQVPKKDQLTNKQLHFLQSLKQVGQLQQNWLCGFYTGLMNLPIMILGALWGNLYLVQTRNLSTAMAGNLTSLIFLGLIIGSPLMGWMSGKLDGRKSLMAMSAVGIFFIAVIIVYLTLSIFALGSLLFLLGLLSSAQVLSYPLVVKSNPLKIESTALGLVAVIVNMIAASAQILFGWLIKLRWKGIFIQQVPYYSVANFKLALVLLPVAFFASIFLVLGLREIYNKAVSE
jgi:MFS family permease